jgi:hypothetical protein
MFQNSKIGKLTSEKIVIIMIVTLNQKWTPIEPIIKDIRIGKSQSFVITRIQFLIQLAIAKIIHHS